MKLCPKCGKRRRVTSFHRNKNTLDKLTVYCKYCQKAYARKWRSLNRDRELAKQRARYDTPAVKQYKRNHHLRKTYGITLIDYHKLRRKQNGLCLICRRYFGNKLVVDHDHRTGQVRGLLCQGCNTGLRLFDCGRHMIGRVLRYLNLTLRGK